MRRYRSGSSYPSTAEELRASELMAARWYYSVELLPGVVATGQYPHDVPLLPRLALRRCDVAGASCLDVGTMEGVIPTLLAKRGAREVLAVDAANHALGKLAAVRHYHGVDFDYRSVGFMYDLDRTLGDRGFDLVNCSGLLYHVFSPLGLLGAVRPLVNRDGLVVISTYVTLDPDPVMEFNAGGRFWAEGNTFWILSVPLLDYLLRYMRLLPIDCLHLPTAALSAPWYERLGRNFDFEKDAAYVSVVCRAVDAVEADPWMQESMRTSWEWRGMVDWARAENRPRAEIGYRGDEAAGGLDLATAVRERPPVSTPASADDSHYLGLEATS